MVERIVFAVQIPALFIRIVGRPRVVRIDVAVVAIVVGFVMSHG